MGNEFNEQSLVIQDKQLIVKYLKSNEDQSQIDKEIEELFALSIEQVDEVMKYYKDEFINIAEELSTKLQKKCMLS